MEGELGLGVMEPHPEKRGNRTHFLAPSPVLSKPFTPAHGFSLPSVGCCSSSSSVAWTAASVFPSQAPLKLLSNQSCLHELLFLEPEAEAAGLSPFLSSDIWR